MTERETDDPFYSFGNRIKKDNSSETSINKLHKDAKEKASDAGVPVSSENKLYKFQNKSQDRKFKTKNSYVCTQSNTVKSSNQGWKHNATNSNPYLAQNQNKKLNALIAKRAKEL